MTDGSATDMAGGCVRRHAEADELLYGAGDGRQVALQVFPRAQLAARNCIACDVLHDDVSTTAAQEDEVDVGDAHNGRRVRIHNLGHLVLCAGLTQVDADTVLDPESRDAFDLEADAVLTIASCGTVSDDGVTRGEVCRGVHGMILDLLDRHC